LQSAAAQKGLSENNGRNAGANGKRQVNNGEMAIEECKAPGDTTTHPSNYRFTLLI
jgi:hypothetical protein